MLENCWRNMLVDEDEKNKFWKQGSFGHNVYSLMYSHGNKMWENWLPPHNAVFVL